MKSLAWAHAVPVWGEDIQWWRLVTALVHFHHWVGDGVPRDHLLVLHSRALECLPHVDVLQRNCKYKKETLRNQGTELGTTALCVLTMKLTPFAQYPCSEAGLCSWHPAIAMHPILYTQPLAFGHCSVVCAQHLHCPADVLSLCPALELHTYLKSKPFKMLTRFNGISSCMCTEKHTSSLDANGAQSITISTSLLLHSENKALGKNS